MLFKNKFILFLFLLYIISTTVLFVRNISLEDITKTSFFWQDDTIAEDIHKASILDGNKNSVLLTRFFHNKIFSAADTFFISVYRAVDPVFLFSLSDMSSMYEDQGEMQMLFPIELPLFLFSCIYLLRHWQQYKEKYPWLLVFFIGSVLFTGIFLPHLHQSKFLFLVIAIRTVLFVGILEYSKTTKWAKKFF